MKQNYQLILDETIKLRCGGVKKPSLLLQACCAPCSSYVLEYLNKYFNITLYFYNPNISPKKEFDFRYEELCRLTEQMPLNNKPKIICGEYDNKMFNNTVKGLEQFPEGDKRCFLCYRLRLEQTAIYAKENNFDFFCTTLSISPYKNAQKLNEIGKDLSLKHGVDYLFSDFKKKEGYKRSIELSTEYNLYRQNYCGCVYSKRAADSKNEKPD